jgi:transposase InsO family protein
LFLAYLRCWKGTVFFAFVLDAFSRRVVGWQLAAEDWLRTTLEQARRGTLPGMVRTGATFVASPRVASLRRTAAPSDWDGRQNQCPRHFLARNARALTPGA